MSYFENEGKKKIEDDEKSSIEKIRTQNELDWQCTFLNDANTETKSEKGTKTKNENL